MSKDKWPENFKGLVCDLRHSGELRFKVRAIEALLEAEMEDAAQLVMQLSTSGEEEP